MAPRENQPDASPALDAAVRRHPAGSRLTAEQAARIAARSVCPRCDGRPAAADEESYATCIFCASGSTKPAPPLPAEPESPPQPDENRPRLRLVPGTAPATHWGDDEPLALD